KVRATTRDGQPLCSTCRSRDTSFHEVCSKCGRTRRPIGRQEDGQAICGTCYSRGRKAPCSSCGRDSVITARIDGQPYCARCNPGTITTCAVCGLERYCHRETVPP